MQMYNRVPGSTPIERGILNLRYHRKPGREIIRRKLPVHTVCPANARMAAQRFVKVDLDVVDIGLPAEV